MQNQKFLAKLASDRRSWGILCVLIACFAGQSMFAEADMGERSFNVPSGRAVKTLKQAAQQAGVDIIFSARTVRGVNTPALNGVFGIKEAFDRMLADEPVSVIQHEKSGIIAIKPRERSQDLEPQNESEVNMNKDTKPSRLGLLRKSFAAALAALASQTVAQDGAEETEGDFYELSPFVVDASEEEGYRATSTLAGTRIRTSMKDVASSIQLVTSEFIEDTAATDAESLFVYTTNTEVAGLGGNFTGSSSAQGGGVFFSAARNNLADEVRLRGIAAPDTSRDFFPTEIPMDTYNVQSVAINRGANSVLFGLGSPAGILEYNLKSPMKANETTVQFRIGSFGGWRSIADVNRSLLDDVLKVRVIGLIEEEKFEQNTAFERDERVFAAVEYSPKWDKTLTFNTSYERGDIAASRPMLTPPIDRLTPWWEFGQLTVDPSSVQTDELLASVDPATGVKPLGPFGNTFQEGQVVFANPFSAQPGDGSGTPDAMQVFIRSDFLNGRDFDFAMAANAGTGSLRSNNPDFFGPGSDKFIDQTIADENIFDFRNRNAMGRTQVQWSDFDEFNFRVEKLFFEGDLGIELAYNNQSVDRGNIGGSAGARRGIGIDINETLVNGDPNPNFGRPFVATRVSVGESGSESETWRATAFGEYDFAEKFGDGPLRFLGKHTVTGLLENRIYDSYGTSFNLAAKPASFLNSFNRPLLDPSNWGPSSRSFQIVKYLGDRIDGLSSPTEAAPLIYGSASPNGQFPQDVSDGLFFVRDPVDGAGGAWQRGQSVDALTYFDNRDMVASSGSLNGLEVDSEAVVLNSSMLSDSITSILGFRSDTVKSRDEGLPTLPGGQANVNTPNTVRSRFTADDETSADTFTWGTVLHVNELPGIGDLLPGTVDLRLHAGESENFTTGVFLKNVWGEPLPSQGGTTEEYGFSMDFFDGKLSTRVNWFETAQANVPVRDISYWGIWLLPEKVYNDHTAAEIEAAGWVGLPQEVMDTANFVIGEPDPVTGKFVNATHEGAARSNVSDTQDVVGKGVEIEMVYNPTKNWTMMFNAARQEAAISNTIPGIRRLLEFIDPSWREAGELLTAAGGMSLNDRRFRWMDRTIDRALAREGALNQEVREWRVNFVTNYRFSEGMLDGFNAGGAYRWEDSAAIGASFDEDFELDFANPHFGPSNSNVDAWVGYTRKIFNDRADWKLQLNVRNVLDDDDLVPIVANPDGSIAVHRIPAPRTWQLTSTITF